MTDQKTLAYINMYGILGALPKLCALDKDASELCNLKKPVSLCMSVKDGPSATFTFENGECSFEIGEHKCDIKLPFSSCEKFNRMIDGTLTPIPSKGFTKIGFLLKNFTKLLAVAGEAGSVTSADLYDNGFIHIEGKTKEGKTFTISMSVKEEEKDGN